ncbi:hypothetical protein GYMLUDRAFT_857655 [Collybiopsis luxurians FD-317 M1]|nr:hypothetical protein GYMLUDRAFT_857655 [Collybiopsis luxurians FD-317 M1]
MDSELCITYIDRAVQTEPPRYLSRSDNGKALNLHNTPVHDDAAYTPLTIPKREHKLSQLTYKKPLELNILSQRVVSLPETSPPSRMKPGTIRDRVVSMSEQIKTSLVSSANNSLSSDCFETSIETSQTQSSDVGNSSRNSRSLRSLRFPQTPSPPSSPESVMIIGNNVQVPSSFLRQKASNFANVDDEGWMTWTSSPPRPIPALHGPLSLPYARCPSGAEGTIIDGEDMTRTIWGLGCDPGSKNDNGVGIEPKVTLQPPVAQRQDTHSLREAPIRLHTLNKFPLQQPDDLGKSLANDAFYMSPNIPGINNASLIQPLSGFKQSYEGRSSAQGLGLVWNNPETSSSSSLKASAPEFVPSGRLSHHLQPRITLSPRIGSHFLIPKSQVSTIDPSYEVDALRENQLTPLLGSPPSTSTNWSPYLPTPLPLHTGRFVDVWNSEDTFEELRHFISERVGQQNLSPSELKQISELLRAMNSNTRTHLSYSQSPSLLNPKNSLSSSTADIDLHLSGPPQNHQLSSWCTGTLSTASPSPRSSHGAGKAHVQPRSVPFARLLQRQLSMVPEETAPASEQPLASPRPERTAFGGNADAYKPYFAHTAAQQKASRLPDASNHASAGPMSRLHSSNSKSFTAGNLEVGEYVPRINSTTHIRNFKIPSHGEVVPERRDRQRKVKSNLGLAPSSHSVNNKENGPAFDKNASVESNKSIKIPANAVGKDGGRKKSKLMSEKLKFYAGDPVERTTTG